MRMPLIRFWTDEYSFQACKYFLTSSSSLFLNILFTFNSWSWTSRISWQLFRENYKWENYLWEGFHFVESFSEEIIVHSFENICDSLFSWFSSSILWSVCIEALRFSDVNPGNILYSSQKFEVNVVEKISKFGHSYSS